MAQIFPRWSNKAPMALGLGLPLLTSFVVFALWYWASPKYTDVGYAPRQPVSYSHKLHAADLGMDCRYCHNTVEQSFYAAVPPSSTCMNCHNVVLKESPKLAPVRSSVASGMPVPWIKVHQLPDYAYFYHNVHVAAGLGCAECHGRVDHMKIVHLHAPLSMSWCLQCHRAPYPRLRPVSEVTNMSWDRNEAGYDPNTDPARKRKLNPPVHCSGCHR